MRRALILAGVTFLLSAGLAGATPPRVASYQRWVKHYQNLVGLQDLQLEFVTKHHPEYCAWVTKLPPATGAFPPGMIFVGLSFPDAECESVPERTLAMHEMCHLRMMHLEVGVREMSTADMHYEVRECMKAYEEREREGE